ncbi:MAG: hypothetical protein ACI8TQ_001753 [Planctomycetota bacterium]|jgi:uncharacterized protein (TIRG00374 family)
MRRVGPSPVFGIPPATLTVRGRLLPKCLERGERASPSVQSLLKTPLRIFLSLAVAGGLLTALMLWVGVNLDEVVAALSLLTPAEYLLAVCIHAGIYSLRALRFRLLVPPAARPPFGRTLTVSAAHNLASYVLPAKTGEASFILYLKRFAGVSGARGLASLLVSRLLDLAVMCSGISLACFYLATRSEAVSNERMQGLMPVAILLLACTLVFSFLGARGHLLVIFIEKIARFSRLDRIAFGRKVLARFTEVEDALRGAGGEGRLFFAAVLSVPLWALVFGFYFVLGCGFGLPDSTSYAEVVFGSSATVIFNLLPVNGVAGFGTQELGWTFGFEFLGVDRKLALASGISTHLVQLFNVCLFGVLGHLVMGWLKPTAASDEES